MGQIRRLSMHDALGAEDFVPADANVELDRICGPMWALRCPSAIFRADMDASPFLDMARRKF